MKRCSRCEEEKVDSAFYKVAGKDSLRPWCKECQNEDTIARNSTAEGKARVKEWRQSRDCEVSVATKICSKCGEVKQAVEFYRYKVNKDGLHSWCKTCCSRDSAIRASRPEARRKAKEWCLANRDKLAVTEAKRRKERWATMLVQAARAQVAKHLKAIDAGVRKDHGPDRLLATITIEDVLAKWEEQRGLCYWFGIPMVPSEETRNPARPSLDRLDGAKGYTRENVVLTCAAANLARNCTPPEKFRAFVDSMFELRRNR